MGSVLRFCGSLVTALWRVANAALDLRVRNAQDSAKVSQPAFDNQPGKPGTSEAAAVQPARSWCAGSFVCVLLPRSVLPTVLPNTLFFTPSVCTPTKSNVTQRFRPLPQAKSITVTSDGREKAAAAAAQPAPAAAEPAPAAAQPAAAAPSSEGAGQDNAAEARAWIAAWRAKQGGSTAPAAAASGAAAEQPAADVLPNVAEAREWIRSWRAAQLEKRLPADSVSKQ